MIEMTLTVPDQLAVRLQPMTAWLPTVLELSLQGFKTPAAQTVSEIITFLSAGPPPQAVIMFTVSQQAQTRLTRLLALNQAGLLSSAEQDELDELEHLEHLMVLLKVEAQKQLRQPAFV